MALQAGPEALTPSGRADEPRRWQARRAETVLAAAVGHRHAAAAAWDGKRKGVKGTLAALLRLRPSRVARRRIAHHNLATPRPPRAALRGSPLSFARGVVALASRVQPGIQESRVGLLRRWIMESEPDRQQWKAGYRSGLVAGTCRART